MDPVTAPARTWLFVPATRPERFAKAASSGADRVIVDLEDAVAPSEKPAARALLAAAHLPASLPLYVRINGGGTEWFDDDLELAWSLPVAGLVLPKAERAETIAHVAARLAPGQAIVPILESALGVWDAEALARAPRVERLAFGAMDFELDTGMQDAPDGDAHAYARSRVALASRVAGVAPPIDSVTASIDDAGAVARDAARALRFGFAGKLCIHPRQVGAIHGAFRPSDAELEWARALLAARSARPPGERGAFAFRGTMVDRPVVDRARRVLSLAGEMDMDPLAS